MSSGWAKPKGLGPEYGRQFQDQSVANAYPTRPPYPHQMFDLLLGLVRDKLPWILDLGCGTGDISRSLAPRVKRIDAVDPSAAMIARGLALPGGEHPNLNWIISTAEDFTYPGPYALVITAESLHWMDWYAVLPQIHRSLTQHGRLAIVLGRGFRNEPWATEVGQLIAQYSTNREYERYDLLRELVERKLFVLEQSIQTQPVSFSQTVEEYVESFHSRNGLSRDRMGSSAKAFDAQLKAIIARYQSASVLEFELIADLAWGIPAAD
jgi:SAM-dependent methyltransferase